MALLPIHLQGSRAQKSTKSDTMLWKLKISMAPPPEIMLMTGMLQLPGVLCRPGFQ